MSLVTNLPWLSSLTNQQFKEVYATVEVKGEYTYGMMVVDWGRMLKRPNNVRLVTKFDNEEFLKMLYRPVNWK